MHIILQEIIIGLMMFVYICQILKNFQMDIGQKKIAEKKAKDPKYKSKKDSEKDSETEEKEAIVEKVECFGEELQPDFSVKKVKRL